MLLKETSDCSMQMSALQHERLAAETTTERDTRLQRMRDRLAAETNEERDARLECDRARHREQQNVQSQLPLLQQCSIQAKMCKLHANMATLDTPVSTTCSERFPGIQLYAKLKPLMREN